MKPKGIQIRRIEPGVMIERRDDQTFTQSTIRKSVKPFSLATSVKRVCARIMRKQKWQPTRKGASDGTFQNL
jgi:hypothetical protein